MRSGEPALPVEVRSAARGVDGRVWCGEKL